MDTPVDASPVLKRCEFELPDPSDLGLSAGVGSHVTAQATHVAGLRTSRRMPR